jgi:DNA polymerase-3 subunit epsilon/ATP-dependent DNA helicase DinG
MLNSSARAISEERHLLVEAGTGTGKSLAYLVPAALFAVQNQKRVVISTNTINLQEQLIEKDIPDIKAALGLDLEAVVLKGRANYICPRRLRGMLHQRLENADQVRMLAKVLVWLLNTHSGDRSELSFNRPQDNQVWQRISADDEGCTIEACLKHSGGGCPLYARFVSQGAQLIVVNMRFTSDVAWTASSAGI